MQPSYNPGTDDVDYRRLSATLRRHLLPILGLSVLAGGGSYLLASRSTPVYYATGSIITQDAGSGAPLVPGLAQAPRLPQGAVAQALQSESVVQDVIRRIDASDLPAATKRALVQSLRGELAMNALTRLSVSTPGDEREGGVYQLYGRANDPETARVLTQAGLDALLRWDTNRVRNRYTSARTSLERQVTGLDERIASTNRLEAPTPAEREGLLAARAQTLQTIAQLEVLERSASGTLDLVSEPVRPSRPAAPRPTRSGLIAGLVTLLLGSGAALLLAAGRRRIYGELDLPRGSTPVLGRLPRLGARALRRGVVTATHSGALYDSAGFLRVNVLSQLPDVEGRARRVVISSADEGEGKSSVTAALAASLADEGARVLVVDADPAGVQRELWRPGAGTRSAPALKKDETPAARALSQDYVTLQTVSDHVDLLLPNPAARAGRAARAELDRAMNVLGADYDVILVDTPALLTTADAVSHATHADGLLLVVASGSAGRDVEEALSQATTAHVRVLGFVLNKLVGLNPGRQVPAQELSGARSGKVTSEAVTS
ncbi:polysaccharide biosynthesis tyrosine autokinase [Deinococcus pimensis]|uniref:polysaccharide biosynthesis tyrosine autokinase n=1 Tax=Deinococcus pimensis TaxID=309888 RepID=UPI0004B54417|nr:polysaccharide biosynthesis tyrosine autokinase [Deinococcus pimensis]